MNKIALIPVFIVVLLSGCDLWTVPWTNYDDPYFANIPTLGLTTVPEVMQWVSLHIDYKSDEGHYFQSPGETYDLLTGDCEDFAGITMYLLRNELGLDPMMVSGYMTGETSGHMWVNVNEEWWEPNGAYRCEHYITRYNNIAYWGYAQTMWRAIEMKRSVM